LKSPSTSSSRRGGEEAEEAAGGVVRGFNTSELSTAEEEETGLGSLIHESKSVIKIGLVLRAESEEGEAD
jgi:hypothetical protein